jgi:hypothetical protein
MSLRNEFKGEGRPSSPFSKAEETGRQARSPTEPTREVTLTFSRSELQDPNMPLWNGWREPPPKKRQKKDSPTLEKQEGSGSDVGVKKVQFRNQHRPEIEAMIGSFRGLGMKDGPIFVSFVRFRPARGREKLTHNLVSRAWHHFPSKSFFSSRNFWQDRIASEPSPTSR